MCTFRAATSPVGIRGSFAFSVRIFRPHARQKHHGPSTRMGRFCALPCQGFSSYVWEGVRWPLRAAQLPASSPAIGKACVELQQRCALVWASNLNNLSGVKTVRLKPSILIPYGSFSSNSCTIALWQAMGDNSTASGKGAVLEFS